MTVRSSMTTLIARTALLIGDSGNAQFSTQQVQDQLDHHRIFVKYAFLRPWPDLTPGGILYYNEYHAQWGDWESDLSLTDRAFNDITGSVSSSSELDGFWRFDNTPSPGQQPPVRIQGKTYDVWAAVADLLEMWASSLALAVDVLTDGNSYRLSQQRAGLLLQAKEARKKARARTVQMFRSDEESGVGIGYTAWYDDPYNV